MKVDRISVEEHHTIHSISGPFSAVFQYFSQKWDALANKWDVTIVLIESQVRTLDQRCFKIVAGHTGAIKLPKISPVLGREYLRTMHQSCVPSCP